MPNFTLGLLLSVSAGLLAGFPFDETNTLQLAGLVGLS
jgi:hypothetical protein